MHSWELKLRRATDHLKAIDEQVTGLLDRCEADIRCDMRRDGDFLKIFVRAPRHPSSEELALTIGDFIHNVRSSLDHLIAYLVEMNRRPVTTATQFPIFKTGSGWKTRGLVQIRGLPEQYHAAVDGLQPYQRGDELAASAPLWLLKELSNWDKHHMPAFVWLTLAMGALNVDAPNLEEVSIERVHLDGPVEPGATLAIGTYRVIGSNPEVSVRPHLTMKIVFASSMAAVSGLAVVPTLAEILRTVAEDVFPVFDPIPSPIYVAPHGGFERNPNVGA